MAVSKFKVIEEKYGKPMPEILDRLYEQFGSQTEVAKYLGVSQGTLSLWLARMGLRQVTRLEPIRNGGRNERV